MTLRAKFGTLTVTSRNKTEESNVGRPVKKVHKSQQQRLQEAQARRAEQQKKEDRNTYIMLGVVAVIFVVLAAVLIF